VSQLFRQPADVIPNPDVAAYAARARERSELFWREHAMTYALGYIGPLNRETPEQTVARLRSTLAALEQAGVL
jgi:hypothetical protein